MGRYFYKSEWEKEGQAVLGGEDAHHLGSVLRCLPGDKLELCDEVGNCRRAEIISISKEGVTCRLLETLPGNEPLVKVTLAFALLKGEKTELVLQKATELGVSCFVPFSSERSVTRLTEKKAQERALRWQKIVRQAAGQCRRALIPQVKEPCDWEALLALFPHYSRVIFCWEDERIHVLGRLLRGVAAGDNILLITGPEGGFSAVEAKAAQDSGARAVTLGTRILRAETAAVAAAALVLYEAGELGGKP
ncbi:MAG: 16S rRNA (uracil(1498)-N(3))-methyltransferase [Dethiobacter sp.]|jgi:16S rRNA (uracil1498-N3)-methyltransferase|nr:16S rRNA (uracil(1498)-N(3))-methyltransferase [Dethiobacter sp.]